jgi:hypothetical protein
MKIVLRFLLIFISYAMTTSKTLCERHYSRTNISWMQAGKIRTNGKNNIGASRIVFLPKPERFSNNPFETISFNCATNLPMHTDSEPAGTHRIWLTDQRKPYTMQPFSLAVNFFKLPSFPQQGAF